MSPLPDSSALLGVDPRVRTIPLENISSLAGANFSDPDIIPLWFGEGDVKTPAFIGEAMMRARCRRETCSTPTRTASRPIAPGARDLPDRPRSVRPVAPDRITVTTSGMHAIQIALQLIVGPGSSVIVIDPVWPNFASAARLMGADVRPVRMDHDAAAGWTLDLDKVAAAMDSTRSEGGVLRVSPGNPTGAMIPIETQAALLEMCRVARNLGDRR